MSDSQNVQGSHIDEYEVLERLASSKTGQLLKVRHRTMGRLAVVKIMSERAASSAQMIERFRRTVLILAQLNHPNLVAAYTAGVYNGSPYVATEYIDGNDLRTLLKRLGPMPVANAVNYLSQAAAGLQYAHSQGVYHRNIKPGNLMLDRQGVVKVIGMGLARVDVDSALAEDGAAERLTMDGQAMGSYEYMAPEQALNPHAADGRADIYSLGCTLYKLLTGASPFPGETPVQMLIAHSTAPIPSLHAARRDVPAALDAVLQKMLAKKPEDRYQSMDELLIDFGQFIEGKPAREPEAGVTSSREIPVSRASETFSQPPPAGQQAAAATVPQPSAAASSGKRPSPAVFARMRRRKFATWQIVVLSLGGVTLATTLFLLTLYLGGFSTSHQAHQAAPAKENPSAAKKSGGGKDTTSAGKTDTTEVGGDRHADDRSGDTGKKVPGGEPISSPSKTDSTPPTPAGPDKTIAKNTARTKAVNADSDTDPSQIKLEPQPAAKPDPPRKADTSTKPEPLTESHASGEKAAPPASDELPVPDEKALAAAEKTADEMFKEEIQKTQSSAARITVADKLYRQGTALEDDPAGRFVLWKKSVNLFASAANLERASMVIDDLASHYAIDVFAMRVDALSAAARSLHTADEHKSLGLRAMALTGLALEEGEFQAAGRLVKIAQGEAGKARDKDLTAQIKVVGRELDDVQHAVAVAEEAAKTLQDDPSSAGAKAAIGWCECGIKGHWDKGLPLLAGGSYEVLREMAEKDLAKPLDAEKQVAVADGWWSLSEKKTGLVKKRLRQRAAYWYELAAPKVTGLVKAKVDKRLQALAEGK